MKTYKIKGYVVVLHEGAETGADYTEFDITVDGNYIGQVTKYTDDNHWTAWDDQEEELTQQADKRKAVEKVLVTWTE